MSRNLSDNMVVLETTILEALKIIDTHGVPIGLVHNKNVLCGTVTDGDIRRGILAGVQLTDSVEAVMNRKPITAPSGTTPTKAAQLMRYHAIGHLPLVDSNGHITDLKVLRDFETKGEGSNPIVLMAGGRGTRLHPLTETLPKPLLEVGGRPILQNIIERFVAQGFNQFYLSVNYKADLIQAYFGDGSAFGADISYLHEDEAMGTGGALSLLPDRPDLPLIVMNGDVLTNINFHQLLKYHKNHAAQATMSVHQYRFTVPFGVVEADVATLLSIAEKPEHAFFVNAGIYVIDPDVLDAIPPGKAMDMPDLFQQLLNEGKRPSVFPLREYWMDIGRLDDLDQAKRDFADLFPESATKNESLVEKENS